VNRAKTKPPEPKVHKGIPYCTEECKGIPYCTEECSRFDGKRCDLMGFRPDGICEPAVKAMADEIKTLRARLQSRAGEVAALEAAAEALADRLACEGQ
jgi:hypothetical protein